MNHKKIVVLDADTLPGRVFHFDFPHELAVYGTTGADETAERVRDAHIV
ncbi:TPA: D-2-hydroxyacid dehydrogenase, partial [Neisseria meningitidis]